jgi:hypothetical protein
LERRRAFFANIAGSGIKQNRVKIVKWPVVKVADFLADGFLYGGFHDGL